MPPMEPHCQPPTRDPRVAFLRVLGIIWAVLMLVTLVGAAVAPHAGRLLDVCLAYTVHWEWTALNLEANQPFFDLSTPATTVQSYYSALYQHDMTQLERLAQGAFREHLLTRAAYRASSPAPTFPSYRSYLRTELRPPQDAVVLEKLHLFWQHGLRFHVQQHATGWRIVDVQPLQ